MTLADETCASPRGQTGPDEAELAALSALVPAWEVERGGGTPLLRRAFSFDDFASAVSFASRVGAEADEQDHHPRLTVEWGSVLVEWWTHATGGLHRNDFIMAARTDRIYGA